MKVKSIYKKVIYVSGTLCMIFVAILFKLISNYESKIKNMNSDRFLEFTIRIFPRNKI